MKSIEQKGLIPLIIGLLILLWVLEANVKIVPDYSYDEDTVEIVDQGYIHQTCAAYFLEAYSKEADNNPREKINLEIVSVNAFASTYKHIWCAVVVEERFLTKDQNSKVVKNQHWFSLSEVRKRELANITEDAFKKAFVNFSGSM